MKKSTKIVLSVLCLLLCVSLCFAWIDEIDQVIGRYMQFFMKEGNAVVASANLDVTLYKDATGEDDYVDITKVLEQGDTTPLTHFSNFAPGSRQKFRADIKNTADVPVYVHMVLSDIVCSNADLQQHLIVGTSGFGGFRAPYLPPELVSNSLKDGMNDGNFSLMQGAEIPPDSTISVYFYVIFSENATEALANTNFKIGSINFLTV